ncbi:hypothetical protein SKAU_G00414570 [Synaphobranchus kaupii]|uniref:Uncharacterized protein n=1 Tax=Synaphobranchus kaupii TaxID=118154 RepID=A0A9Q1IBE2_SYNKA|nr:hypothetical protein SKAU_G00414570 [Synaphobranchus kaupii]
MVADVSLAKGENSSIRALLSREKLSRTKGGCDSINARTGLDVVFQISLTRSCLVAQGRSKRQCSSSRRYRDRYRPYLVTEKRSDAVTLEFLLNGEVESRRHISDLLVGGEVDS